MPYLRPSRARSQYSCAGCGEKIGRGDCYFRDEPHPRARYFRGAEVRYLCAVCVLGHAGAEAFFAEGLLEYREKGQLGLIFGSPSDELVCVPARVELVDITPQLRRCLARDPELMRHLSAESFEALVFDLLTEMGFQVQPVGEGTYQRDGGIDAVAWPTSSAFPFLLAVQAKHARVRGRRVGPGPLRDLFGAVQAHGFNAGVLVTNTSFTPDARWFAEQRPTLIHLRDNEDLRRWLRSEFLPEYEWQAMPSSIEVCPGITVALPR